MSVLLPQHLTSVILLVSCLSAEFLLGRWFVNKKFLRTAWLFPLGSVFLIHVSTSSESPGFRMIALILALLTGMKVVTATLYPQVKFSWQKWFLYCFSWVGMNPEVFFKHRANADRTLLFRGLSFFLSGLLILIAIKYGVRPTAIPDGVQYYLLSLLLLVSLSMILHFGLLNINAWFLQRLGFPAYSLFRAPLSAKSLTDFWGKRWNLAFTEMTSVAVYRPLSKTTTATLALGASFLVSGLLHEVALTLPVQYGFGLPLVYFSIQLLLVVIEQKIIKRKPGVIWVIGGLVLPLPVLFHPFIMKAVFWQFVL